MIITLDAEDTVDKNLVQLHDETLEALGIQWTYLNIIKEVLCKSIVNIKLNRETLKVIQLKSETSLPTLFMPIRYSILIHREIKQLVEKNGIQVGKDHF